MVLSISSGMGSGPDCLKPMKKASVEETCSYTNTVKFKQSTSTGLANGSGRRDIVTINL